ncbi:hypothetical protein [Streptomyces triculaminicus]|uniref:hypothetical protein n=1 Tax=Streptomyces triculaminicus TaxID=2816232 RepID=UPI0037D4AED5
MPVYEYHPVEIAKLGVGREATGLDLGQVKERVRTAREREERAREETPQAYILGELAIAVWESLEWERIAHVMTEQQIPVYEPGLDRRAARREEQRLQRMAEERADDERSGCVPVEVLRHRVYRITAKPVDSPAEPTLVHHLMASCLSEAAHRAWTFYNRPGGLYQQGGYRITSVEQVLTEPGEWF